MKSLEQRALEEIKGKSAALTKHTTARLRRKLRRLTLAWNVCFKTPDGEKVRAILGTESEALQVGRLSAHCLNASTWKTVPFPEFNDQYRGQLEPAMCPDWTRVRPLGKLAPQLKELREAVRRIRRIIPPPHSEPDRYEVNYDCDLETPLEKAIALLPSELTLGWREPGIWKFRKVRWHEDVTAKSGEETVLVLLRGGGGTLEVKELDGSISAHCISRIAPLAIFDDTLRHRFIANKGAICQALIFHRPRCRPLTGCGHT